ncbi:MAG: CPBP family intramembrane glutamic endopeptidase [Lachnospiraceae bacterium]|nr:CPBP family intramembrane glutamic endopeptidase [Lachnospiraceae bacterium]
MKTINKTGLLLSVFAPTFVLSVVYFVLGHFIKMPNLLLFCLIATFTMVPIELGIILNTSKKQTGKYSLASALAGQEKMPLWKIVIIAFVLFGIAGLFSVTIAPLENLLFSGLRSDLLNHLPTGFDWTDYEYLRTFSKPVLVVTCIYYFVFNVFAGPVTEELFFRGYLTSHYNKQTIFTPILIAILFSLYHFWLPFNNIFRIMAFAPAAYVAYKKKNIYISIWFHCMCNLFSVVGFVMEVMR